MAKSPLNMLFVAQSLEAYATCISQNPEGVRESLKQTDMDASLWIAAANDYLNLVPAKTFDLQNN